MDTIYPIFPSENVPTNGQLIVTPPVTSLSPFYDSTKQLTSNVQQTLEDDIASTLYSLQNNFIENLSKLSTPPYDLKTEVMIHFAKICFFLRIFILIDIFIYIDNIKV